MSSLWSRARTHVTEIFTAGDGEYVNENGETVYGRLPRAKLENPFKTLCRPSLMSLLPHPDRDWHRPNNW